MAKIRFLREYVVKANSPREDDPKNPKFKQGQEITVSDASARHFVNRGAAEVVDPASQPKGGAQEKNDADKTASKNDDGAGKPAAGAGGASSGSGKSR